MPSFANLKRLRFEITLAPGEKFDDGTSDTVIIEGLRASVQIDNAGGAAMTTMRAKIYGVKPSVINKVTTFSYNPNGMKFTRIRITAVDGEKQSYVFGGNFVNAWGDYQGAPDGFLHIQAQAAFYGQLKATAPRSFKGPVSVALVMSQIAKDLGLEFEDNDVKTIVTDISLANTGLEQAKELRDMAGIGMYIDLDTLAITKSKSTPRNGGNIPVVNKTTGLVSYPTFDGIGGVIFTTLFNPAIRFGGRVKLETDIVRAAGEWFVASISHNLEAEKPDGAWFSTIKGNFNGVTLNK